MQRVAVIILPPSIPKRIQWYSVVALWRVCWTRATFMKTTESYIFHCQDLLRRDQPYKKKKSPVDSLTAWSCDVHLYYLWRIPVEVPCHAIHSFACRAHRNMLRH